MCPIYNLSYTPLYHLKPTSTTSNTLIAPFRKFRNVPSNATFDYSRSRRKQQGELFWLSLNSSHFNRWMKSIHSNNDWLPKTHLPEDRRIETLTTGRPWSCRYCSSIHSKKPFRGTSSCLKSDSVAHPSEKYSSIIRTDWFWRISSKSPFSFFKSAINFGSVLFPVESI